MKVQEVILRAMSGQIKWFQAAEILGMSARSMRRWRWRLEQHGYDGLLDRRTQRPSPRRVPMEIIEHVLRLYRDKYFDFNVKHFHEKLLSEHGIELSYSWVKNALQRAGLVGRRRKRGRHHKRRPRHPLPGMMLHIDGSSHEWLGAAAGSQDLITVMDDATSEIYYAKLVEQESTATVMEALKRVIQQQGIFCSLYSDRASHFVLTPKAGSRPSRTVLTQVGRALEQLGIELIPAGSPQARGRCERSYRTFQGRLPQELRVRGISTVETGNCFLEESTCLSTTGISPWRRSRKGPRSYPTPAQSSTRSSRDSQSGSSPTTTRSLSVSSAFRLNSSGSASAWPSAGCWSVNI
jgi:transposase